MEKDKLSYKNTNFQKLLKYIQNTTILLEQKKGETLLILLVPQKSHHETGSKTIITCSNEKNQRAK